MDDDEKTEVMIDEEADELSLSLGSTSYSLQMPSSMISSPLLAQSSPSLPSLSSHSLPTMMVNHMLYSPFLDISLQQPGFLGSSPTIVHQSGVNPLPNQITSLSNQGIQIGNQNQAGNQNAEVIQPPPYPWATTKRATIQSLENLEAQGITIITGEVECKRCDRRYQVSYNLRDKFNDVEYTFRTKISTMRNRAPDTWKNPEPERCALCDHEKCVKPVIAQRKRQINWLFLFLGQTLGFCTLEQLKNFCKHCKSHRTGAKDRVLYLTYLGLCKMLKPNEELFNPENDNRT